MTTSNITFPLELVEAFVEQLAPGTGIVQEKQIFQTLISCTLASKYFSFAARKRLFSNLVVDRESEYLSQKNTSRNKIRTEEETSRRINTFLHLLADERSSDLALMVRSLHIVVDKNRVILQQATNLHSLLRVLSHRAHNLSMLQVYGLIFVSWPTIPQETADGLYTICRSLPVNHLSFRRVRDIPPIIASAQESPHLLYIDLKNAKFGEIETGMAAESNISPARNVMSEDLDLLGSLSRYGSYEIRHTSDGRTHIVGIDVAIQHPDDAKQLNQLLSDERVRSSLQYCCCDIYKSFLTTTAIDFGTMGLLRKLVIESRIGFSQKSETTRDAITSEIRVDIYQGYQGITDAMNSLIDHLYYGTTKSALQEIKVTLNVGHVLYKGINMFDAVDFGSLQRLRIDSLRQKHPLIQSTQFHMNVGLTPQNSAHPEVQSSVEEIVRKVITDAITFPPIDESLLPKIHICAKREH
ncbi:hypothetical protein CVT25_014579 [Psilocybe cyanescens]|uniref:Uncharacterized protein n=1 Tax=Psilocybe cyanescens TaxID=93625 RepID=A0A409WRE1_PSICY|nr:hypothetical protein CVT25_014579 [Psilocybe cyanescens]